MEVSNQGYTLGLTREGVVFFLNRDSSFIAGWVRDNQQVIEMIQSEEGYRAAAVYDDGYTTLFEHDTDEGEQLWNLRIEDPSLSSLGFCSEGKFTSIASSPGGW